MPRANTKQREVGVGSIPGPEKSVDKAIPDDRSAAQTAKTVLGFEVDFTDEIWSSVEHADRAQVEALFQEIRDHIRADTRFILEKGAELALVKVKEGHGDFEKLILKRTGLKPKTSQRWRKAGKVFKDHVNAASQLQREAIYQLCADGEWVAPVREKVLSDIEDGTVPSLTEVKRLLNQAHIEHDPSQKPISKVDKDARTGRASSEAKRVYEALLEHYPGIKKAVRGSEWSYVKAELIGMLEKLKD